MKKLTVKSYMPVIIMLLGLMAGCGKNSSATNRYEPIDYRDRNNWFKLGEGTADVDVFYLYPTSWTPAESDGIYCKIDNASMREKVPAVYDLQASLFEDFTNIYAPWYRQANAMRTLNMTPEQQDQVLLDYPYKDAVGAFEHYLRHYNNGKPFILAGHSQGANVIKFILQYYMAEHTDVLERMVAAYVPGYSFETDYFERNKHLKFAEGETDTGVVITWNCERQDNGRFGSSNLVCRPGALSINPVSWERGYGKVTADDPRNLGCRFLNGAKYSAQVIYDPARKYEVLIIGIDNEELDSPMIGELSLHFYDFALFYDNVIVNAKKRIAAFLAGNS